MKVILFVMFGLLFLLFFGTLLVRGIGLLHTQLARISPSLAIVVTVLLSCGAAFVAFRLAQALWPHGNHGHPRFV